MPILIEHDALWIDALLASLPGDSANLRDAAELPGYLNQVGDDYAVVVGPNVEMDTATKVATQLRATHPATTVVLLRHEVDAGIYEAAMAAGIPSVVRANDLAALVGAVDRAYEIWNAIRVPAGSEQHLGRVIASFSPKGGVGKTTLTVNLALALSRVYQQKVCIVDMDLAYGDVSITLQLIPEHTIYEAAGGEDSLDFAALEPLLTPHEDCMVLAAPTHSEGRHRISPALVSRVLQVLRDHFDVIVVDNAPSFDVHVVEAINEADLVLLVTTLDVPTIKNMKMAVETLDAMGITREEQLLVLNRADEVVGVNKDNVETLLGMRVRSTIPADSAVANATNHGTPIVASDPTHPVSQQIIELAGKLIPEQAASAGNDGAQSEPPSRLRRLLGRRK